MLRIERSANGEVVFTLSGRMQTDDIDEVEKLLVVEAPGQPVMFDLRDVTLGTRDHNHTFSGLAAFNWQGWNMSAGPEPERLIGARVTAEFFNVLGGTPFLGRTFTTGEMQLGSNRVAILSYGLWQRRFAGSRAVVGQTLKLDRELYTVIGVMPSDFQFSDRMELWTPLALEQSEWQQRGGHYLGGIGRLKDGSTLAAAQADLNAVAARAEQQFPASNSGWDTTIKTLQEQIVGQYRSLMFSLMAVVGAVLLIACVNLANLLLSRSAARARDRHSQLARCRTGPADPPASDGKRPAGVARRRRRARARLGCNSPAGASRVRLSRARERNRFGLAGSELHRRHCGLDRASLRHRPRRPLG